jgi:hypothetical protein
MPFLLTRFSRVDKVMRHTFLGLAVTTPTLFERGTAQVIYSEDGGAEGSRTPDLLIANETLYQLSYDPIQNSNDTAD